MYTESVDIGEAPPANFALGKMFDRDKSDLSVFILEYVSWHYLSLGGPVVMIDYVVHARIPLPHVEGSFMLHFSRAKLSHIDEQTKPFTS